MALGIVKYACNRSSQLIGVIWFAVSLFVVSFSRSVVVDQQNFGPRTARCSHAAYKKKCQKMNTVKLKYNLKNVSFKKFKNKSKSSRTKLQ